MKKDLQKTEFLCVHEYDSQSNKARLLKLCKLDHFNKRFLSSRVRTLLPFLDVYFKAKILLKKRFPSRMEDVKHTSNHRLEGGNIIAFRSVMDGYHNISL